MPLRPLPVLLAAAGIACAAPSCAQTAAAPAPVAGPVATGPSFAELATLAEGAPLAVHARIKDQAVVPAEFRLEPNYPNPFNPYTTIYFQLPRQEAVRLVIYDLRGNLVTVLLDDELQPGRYQCIWDGTDFRDQRVANGIYLYAMTSAEFRAVRKMIFMK